MCTLACVVNHDHSDSTAFQAGPGLLDGVGQIRVFTPRRGRYPSGVRLLSFTIDSMAMASQRWHSSMESRLFPVANETRLPSRPSKVHLLSLAGQGWLTVHGIHNRCNHCIMRIEVQVLVRTSIRSGLPRQLQAAECNAVCSQCERIHLRSTIQHICANQNEMSELCDHDDMTLLRKFFAMAPCICTGAHTGLASTGLNALKGDD